MENMSKLELSLRLKNIEILYDFCNHCNQTQVMNSNQGEKHRQATLGPEIAIGKVNDPFSSWYSYFPILNLTLHCNPALAYIAA